jgi:beta-lactamase class A
VYRALVTELPDSHVFHDIDTLEPGIDFVEGIENAVGSCDVLIAVIGPQWLDSTDTLGAHRLDDPNDFVRIEIVTALERNVRVIPVLVRGATMPTAEALPENLRKLARRNAMELSDQRWDYDLAQLIGAVKKVAPQRAAETSQAEPLRVTDASLAALLPAPVTPLHDAVAGSVATRTGVPTQRSRPPTPGWQRPSIWLPALVATVIVLVIAGGLAMSRLLSNQESPTPVPAMRPLDIPPVPATSVAPVSMPPTTESSAQPASEPTAPPVATATPLPAPTATTPPAPTATTPPAPTVVPMNQAVVDQVAATLRGLPAAHTATFAMLNGPEHVEMGGSEQVPAASTIKLAIMTEVFKQADEGLISLDGRLTVERNKVVGGTGILHDRVGQSFTTLQVLETTLTYSDNVGGNMLIDLVGMNNINATMRDLGFEHTQLARTFMDLEAQARGLDNLTSAADMSEMLRRIAKQQLISPSASREMLRILRLRGGQTTSSLDYMGRLLVPRPDLAHLNGTLTNIRNDAGIVNADDQAGFVLSIFLYKQPSELAAEDAIARAAQRIRAAVANAH